MQLVDWLDDLCVRFIINLPEEELQSSERICFQIEEAQWFYEDFIRPTDPSLPQLNLSIFASRLLRHCPLTTAYSDEQHAAAFKSFMAYKTRVPVRGAILLDENMDKVLLVKGYKKNATWSFPRGKINKDEDDLVCAIREVWEETGYNLDSAGLVPEDRNVHYIDVTMREQHLRMFVFRNVPLDTPFEPQTRKEISKIQWYKLASLPTYHNKRRSHYATDAEADAISSNKLYMVAPFLPALKRWINQQKKLDARRPSHLGASPNDYQDVPFDLLYETEPEPTPIQTNTPTPDPAHELKRLLSLGSALNQPTSMDPQNLASPANGQQAGALLAMLRGSSSGLAPPLATSLPRTPMEQMLGAPHEPQSPHVHHMKHTPRVIEQPPPGFPLSPNRQHIQDATRSLESLGLNGVSPAHMNNMAFANQELQYFPPMPPSQQPGFQHSTHTQPLQGNMSMHPSQFPPQPPTMPTLQPQGHGAIAHGPAAPKASQLPPPSMNSHTMNLLNAFKTPTGHQQPAIHAPRQSIQQPAALNASQQFGNMPSASAFNNGSTHLQPTSHLSVGPQHDMSAPASQMGPPRSNHQNSLLHLFRSPTAQKASPAAQTPASLPDQNHHRAASLQAAQPAQSPQATTATPLAEPPKQRSATMAMLTRTLPTKAKVHSPPKQMPPQMNGGHRGVNSVESLFPAKQYVRHAQTASFTGAAVPEGQPGMAENEATKAPVAILARPGSGPGPSIASRTSPMPPPNAAPSPRKTRPSRATGSSSGSNFTILQRPSSISNRSVDSAKPPQAASPAAPQAETAPKPFQPQLLRRPKPDETGPVKMMPTSQSASQAQKGGDQRDALLALFAKSGQSQHRPAEVIVEGRAGPLSSGSPSPLPSDAAFRSRIASNASVVSNGDGGMKSPSTPVEAKGFLLDYLNGVVNGEHYKGAKRRPM